MGLNLVLVSVMRPFRIPAEYSKKYCSQSTNFIAFIITEAHTIYLKSLITYIYYTGNSSIHLIAFT